MVRLILLVVFMFSTNSFANQQIEGMSMKSATIVADQIAREWLNNHNEAIIELDGEVNHSHRINNRFGQEFRFIEKLSYRVCYWKVPNGEIRYCYDFKRNQKISKNLQ